MIADFFDLFPTSDVSVSHNLTVITLSQKHANKTLHDANRLQPDDMDNATEDDSKSLMNDVSTVL